MKYQRFRCRRVRKRETAYKTNGILAKHHAGLSPAPAVGQPVAGMPADDVSFGSQLYGLFGCQGIACFKMLVPFANYCADNCATANCQQLPAFHYTSHTICGNLKIPLKYNHLWMPWKSLSRTRCWHSRVWGLGARVSRC